MRLSILIAVAFTCALLVPAGPSMAGESKILEYDAQGLRIPAGMNVPKARTLLRGRFPGLSIDANHVFDPSGN